MNTRRTIRRSAPSVSQSPLRQVLNQGVLNRLSAANLARVAATSKNIHKLVYGNPQLVQKLKNAKAYYTRVSNFIKRTPKTMNVNLRNLKRKNVRRGFMSQKLLGRPVLFNKLGSYTGRYIQTPYANLKVKVPNYSYLHAISKATNEIKRIRNMKKTNFNRYPGNNGRGIEYSFSVGNLEYSLEPNGKLMLTTHNPRSGMRTFTVASGVKLSDIVSKSNRKKY